MMRCGVPPLLVLQLQEAKPCLRFCGVFLCRRGSSLALPGRQLWTFGMQFHNETKECLGFTAPFGLNMFAVNVRIARTSQLCASFAGHISTRIWAGPVDH
jgi:hypothetical protein